MAKSGKIKQQTINFDLWILECDFDDIHYVLKEIAPIREYLPNIEIFIYWLCDLDNFFENKYLLFGSLDKEIDYNDNSFRNDFIKEFDEYIIGYEQKEKAICIKILLTILDSMLKTSNGCLSDAVIEKESKNFKNYTLKDYWNFRNEVMILSELIKYYSNQFDKLKHNLPFQIIDKSSSYYIVDDANSNLNWYIELNKSNQSKPKQTTIETPAKAIEPIKLDATQTQIVFLFQKLIDEKLINESLNPKLWNLVSQYFTDKDNKPLNNIHQTKDKLKNTKTGKPKTKSDIFTSIVSDTKNSL